MNGVVIRVGVLRGQDDALIISLERPPLGSGADQNLACHASDPVFVLEPADGDLDVVRAAGARLFEGLSEHEDIRDALIQALGVAHDGRSPLLVELRMGGDAERIPWEAICTLDGQFLALDARWSVGRIVGSRVAAAATRSFRPPLRVVAFLSCLGVPAFGEWAGLAAAVDNSPVAVELLVLAGEPDLEQAIADEQRPNVEVTGLPGIHDFENLRRRISEFRPDVLHFFCHGSTRDGPHLDLGTQSDWRRETTLSSLTLECEQIGQFCDPIVRPWLAVLNCCEGAATTGEIHSLARDLVYEVGLPAVIGMREPIRGEDATSFSASFYPALFDAVARLSSEGPAPVDWPSLLVGPRQALASRPGQPFSASAARRREWTLPVLYVHPDEFRLGPAPADQPVTDASETPESRLVLLEVLRALRVSAAPTSPTDYVETLDRRIAELERHVVSG